MTGSTEIIHGRGFDAEVVRTARRKTASVKVEQGKVRVVVPQSLAKKRIEELVADKTRWIREKLLLQREQPPVRPKEYVNGECFTYLGRNYRLKIEKGPVRSVKLKNGRLNVTVPSSVQKRDQYIRAALKDWYRGHALARLQEKLQRYSQRLDVSPKSVSVRSFSNRWGSCSASGQVQFNWKIIIAPNRIVDYVVVHELCHLQHHNHSGEFWHCVERVVPDYRECKEWLKVHGRGLVIN